MHWKLFNYRNASQMTLLQKCIANDFTIQIFASNIWLFKEVNRNLHNIFLCRESNFCGLDWTDQAQFLFLK